MTRRTTVECDNCGELSTTPWRCDHCGKDFVGDGKDGSEDRRRGRG